MTAATRVPVIAAYALRACFPVRRRIGLLVPALGTLLFALLVPLVGDGTRAEGLTTVAGTGLFGVVLPIACLVIGDAVLGAEIRAGTLHFTWLSPVGFPVIVAGRWLAGMAVAAGVVTVPFALAALVARVPDAAGPLALAGTAGAAAYLGLFILFGVLARRAVVWSLALVLLGERLLGAALSGIAQWSPGWLARAVYAPLGPDAGDLARSGVPDGWGAAARLLLIAAVALSVAAWRLRHLRLTGPSGD